MNNVHSVYIHIPFCKTICSYCDFCKMFYNEQLVDKYLISLKKEITNNYKGELITTIYIGGGSPSSLNLEQLKKLKEIIAIFKLDKSNEFTIEVNVNDVTLDKLLMYKDMGVNRISIGVETINKKFLSFLNRYHTKEDVLNKMGLVKKYFSNINVDFMYGFVGQNIDDLKEDLSFFNDLDVEHISIYSLILEPNTKLYIDRVKSIDEDIESEMYYYIINYLEKMGFKHYEISNFSKKGYQSRHNLVYWNNLEYYGFGLGASGFINNIRYVNTRSINNYLKGNYVLEEEIQTKNLNMENEMILGLRKIEGVNKSTFFDKFNCHIEDVFDIVRLVDSNMLVDENDHLFIPSDKLYIENSILVNFIGGSNNG